MPTAMVYISKNPRNTRMSGPFFGVYLKQEQTVNGGSRVLWV